MARRRLAPAPTPRSEEDVPRAEHSAPMPAIGRLAPSAPIARVAAEAASTAALEELAESVARARDEGRMVMDLPLEAVAPDHLTRDRLPLEDDEMTALRTSIRDHGQRTPIEVAPLTGSLPYGLVSGWRRLVALKTLHQETGEARFATVRALVCNPETAEAAYVAMVEENEIRVGLSYYERARVAALATDRGVFEDEKKALLALFATASRPKRSRIRAFLDIYRALDGSLQFPQALPERLGLRLVEMVRAGKAERIADALRCAAPESAEQELATLQAVAAPNSRVRKPEPSEEILPGISLETRFAADTLRLTLRGQNLTPELLENIRALLRTLHCAERDRA